MTVYTPEDVKPITLLAEAFDGEVLLDDQGEDSEPFRVLSEFEVGGKAYAVLQNDRMKKEDELALFYIVQDEQGELQLATVEDDEEWENILELYDEMSVAFE